MSEAAPQDLRAVAPSRSRPALTHGPPLDAALDLVAILAVWAQTGSPLVCAACLGLWLVAAVVTRGYGAAADAGLPARCAAVARALVLWALLEAAASHLVPGAGVERQWLVAYAAESAVALLAVRALLRMLLEARVLVPRTRRVLVVGGGCGGRAVAGALGVAAARPGRRLVGQVSAGRLPVDARRRVALLEHVRRHRADEVLVAAEDCGEDVAAAIATELRWRGVRVGIVPRIDPLGPVGTTAEIVAGLPVLTVSTAALTAGQRLVKRLMDLVVASTLLIVLAPLMLVVALVIRLGSPGPVLFAQLRVGEGGRSFTVLKFRTMREDADEHVHTVIRLVDGMPVHKFPDDPRVTRIGRWLRATSLDELPQLLNVVRGEMSMVGPRPELPWIVERYEPWQFARLAVPPGITGWWQLNGRSERPMHLNTDYDLFYIERYSALLDLKLLLRTAAVPFRRRGAF